MSYATIQTAIDYYIGYIDKVSKSSIAPPKLEVLSYEKDKAPTNCWLRVAERKNFKTNNVFAIRYSLSSKPEDTLGPITFEEYTTLNEELDTALVEYRRVNFKKISRQQRHADEKNTRFR